MEDGVGRSPRKSKGEKRQERRWRSLDPLFPPPSSTRQGESRSLLAEDLFSLLCCTFFSLPRLVWSAFKVPSFYFVLACASIPGIAKPAKELESHVSRLENDGDVSRVTAPAFF